MGSSLRRFAQQLTIDECFTVRFSDVSTREFLGSRGFGATVIDGFCTILRMPLRRVIWRVRRT